jgi:hypothetical protein
LIPSTRIRALPAAACAAALLAAALPGCAPGPSQPDLPPEIVTWSWHNPRPFGQDVEGVWGVSPDDVHAVGEGGLILHFDGASWNHIPSPAAADLHDVHGCAADDIYAVGAAGTILHFDGARWRRIEGGQGLNLVAVWCRSPRDVHVVSELGTVLHHDGSGWSETVVGTGHARGDYQDVWGSADGRIFAVGRVGTAALLEDGAWRRLDPGGDHDLFHVFGRSSAEVYATGRDPDGDGVLLFWDGIAWSRLDWPLDEPGALCEADGVLYVVEGDRILGEPFATGGEVYHPVRPPGDLLGLDGGEVFGVGPAGLLLCRRGLTWRSPSSGPTLACNALDGLSRSRIWAAGQAGRIMTFEGAIWTEVPTPTDENLLGLWIAAADDAWAVGARGVILRWDGMAWNFWELVSGETLHAVWGAAPDDVYIGGEDGILLHFDGAAYRPLALPGGEDILAIGGRAADDVYVCAGTQVYRGHGDEWELIHPGDPGLLLTSIWVSPDTEDVFAGGRFPPEDGRRRSRLAPGGGMHWISGAFRRTWIGGVLGEVHDVRGLSPDEVYAATSRGVVRFDGERWEAEPELDGRPYRAVWTDPDGGAYAAGVRGEVRHRPAR